MGSPFSALARMSAKGHRAAIEKRFEKRFISCEIGRDDRVDPLDRRDVGSLRSTSSCRRCHPTSASAPQGLLCLSDRGIRLIECRQRLSKRLFRGRRCCWGRRETNRCGCALGKSGGWSTSRASPASAGRRSAWCCRNSLLSRSRCEIGHCDDELSFQVASFIVRRSNRNQETPRLRRPVFVYRRNRYQTSHDLHA